MSACLSGYRSTTNQYFACLTVITRLEAGSEKAGRIEQNKSIFRYNVSIFLFTSRPIRHAPEIPFPGVKELKLETFV
jgi:hypothetical protein